MADDPVLEQIAEATRLRNLPPADPSVGLLLGVLARAVSARRILELGTGLGYSAIWLGRALDEDGQLFTIEPDTEHAAAARLNLEQAGLADRTHVMIGDPARRVHKVAGPFDLIFDGNTPPHDGALLDRLVALLRPGGLLVTGSVLDTTGAPAGHNERLSHHASLLTAFVPLDRGLALSVKR